MDIIKFGSTALVGSNKTGILKPDDKGYYTVVVGALNIFNSAGQWYELKGSEELFTDNGAFKRRVNNNALRGEVGHPVKEGWMSYDDYLDRILEIRETNTCVHFKDIWLDMKSASKNNGTKVPIVAKIIPSGPHAAMLERSLNNPEENVCFSIRAFTQDYNYGGKYCRVLKNIITFDYVNEPGISIANKYESPALENLSEQVVTKNQLFRIATRKKDSLSMESINIANSLIDSMGWKLPADAVPAFTKW